MMVANLLILRFSGYRGGGGYGLNYFRNRKSAGCERLDNLFGFLSSFPVISLCLMKESGM